MGYFKVLRMAKIKGAGLYFLCNHSECARFWIAVLSLQSEGPFLADCISGFPAFAENDGMGNGNDRLGCLPCTFVTQQTFVTVAHSPSSPLLRKRRKAGVHSWLNVFLDSLLSQRMTKRETGKTEWGAYPAPSSPSRVPFYFLFFRNG